VLAIDQHMALNFSLKVGVTSASVEVSEAPPVLQSTTAEVGTTISGDAITVLPLAGRNFYALTMLVPGVSAGSSGINALNISVSGQRSYSNSVQMDGIESTTNRTQDVTVTPNVDSVEEFKVVTAAYNAEFGNAAGGVIAIQTKAGGNAFHGGAYEFFRPNFITARQTIPGVNTPQPASTLKQHNFGGTIGGPIKKDHSFFFAAYEGMRQHDAFSDVASTIPFGLFDFKPNGDADLSNLVDPYAGRPGVGSDGNPYPAAGSIVRIFDPNVAVANYGWWAGQFPGNVIPKSRISMLRLPFITPASWPSGGTGGAAHEPRFSEVLEGKFHSERLTAYLRQIAQSVENYHSVDIFTIRVDRRLLRVAVLSADSVAASNHDDPAVIRGIVDRSKRLASPFGGPALLRQYYKHVQLASLAWVVARVDPSAPGAAALEHGVQQAGDDCHLGKLSEPASPERECGSSPRRGFHSIARRGPRHQRQGVIVRFPYSQRRNFCRNPRYRCRCKGLLR